MSKISEQDIRKLASLSKLKLSDEEVILYQKELSSIVSYIEQLSDTDVAGLAPTSQVTGLKNVTRADELIDYGVSPAELLKNAPATKENQFKVKRMIA
jgi:aspartyl-tRNA(Asn)/glutamyl-tRNA(Gln) amidotransferase subunit C